MSLHKLSAGSGYDYLTRQVAVQDTTEKGYTGLASYYTERGETPGVWIGSGLAAQIGMLGPVSTIVLSMLVLGEPMGPWQVAGTLLVLGGVLLVSRAPSAGR